MSKTENRLTAFQKGKHCGEIRFTFTVGNATEISNEMRERAENELRNDPQHQASYYDLLLITPTGSELDFETNILSGKAVSA